jgi:hypothetical protein
LENKTFIQTFGGAPNGGYAYDHQYLWRWRQASCFEPIRFCRLDGYIVERPADKWHFYDDSDSDDSNIDKTNMDNTTPTNNTTSRDEGSNQHSNSVPAAAPMTIMVTMPSGKTVAFEVDASDSIESLKFQVQGKEGIPVADQRMISGTKQLDGSQTFAGLNLKNNDCVQLVITIEGGAKRYRSAHHDTTVTPNDPPIGGGSHSKHNMGRFPIPSGKHFTNSVANSGTFRGFAST